MSATVLFDMNNLAIRCLFSKEVIDSNNEIDWELWKYRIISSIYGVFFQVKNVDEIVLAVDDYNSWRKIYFSRYKEKRGEQRDKLDIDWEEYFRRYEELQDEISKHLPLKVIKTKYAEADDIIGTLCLNFDREFHIISTDNDFIQLLSNKVSLYNPVKKKEIEHPQPQTYLQELILTGQSKDGIFNIRTPLDWPNELRKPPLGKKKVEKIFIDGLDNYLDDVVKYRKDYKDKEGVLQTYIGQANLRERYKINQNLIDLSKIPSSLQNKIIRKYTKYQFPSPDNIYYFFKEQGWPEYLEEFEKVEKKFLELY